MVKAGFGHQDNWLEQLEQWPGQDRILFCLDEFERLEEVVDEKPETKQQLVQLMWLLRATIQHRRRVRLLVAGNATFEELGPLWNDTFISPRELQLGPLACDVLPGEELNKTNRRHGELAAAETVVRSVFRRCTTCWSSVVSACANTRMRGRC